jgi:hypothetical protein
MDGAIVSQLSSDKTIVEYRRESRLKISKKAILKVVSLGDGPGAWEPMEVRIADVSGSGIRLEVPLPVPCGAAVEIEDKHTRILGETLRCVAQGDVYIVAVRVSETTTVAGPAAPRIPPIGRT